MMFSTSYYEKEIECVLLPMVKMQAGTKISDAVQLSAKAKAQHILLLNEDTLLGIVPLELLLVDMEDWKQKELIDYADSEFVQIEHTCLQNSSCKDSMSAGCHYDVIYDHNRDCFLGIIDNQSNSKTHENRFADNLKMLNSFFDSSYNGIIALNANSEIILINSSAEKIFEVSAADVMDRSIADMTSNSLFNPIILYQDQQIEYCFTIKDKYILTRCTLIREKDKIIGSINIFQDMTPQKQTETELNAVREREEELANLIQSSYDGIYITDCDGLTLKVNKSHERITGIKANDILGKHMKEIMDEGFVSRHITSLVVERKEPVTVKQSVVNGKEVLITGSPMFDDFGNVKKVITNVRDITELINLEKDLEATKEIANIYKKELFKEINSENIICSSKKFQETLALAKKVSAKDSTVLLLGETGVGKEVVAKFIFSNSCRKNKNYVKLNCGAIAANLLESELFGYVKGAFTGASQSGKMGMFELANEGTLFLDEVGEIPLNLQSGLLRVLQDGEFRRIGDTKSKKVDVRIIAATNRNLEEMVENGLFRKDLFYRLNVFSIEVPPLRERLADIPGLAELMIDRLNKKYDEKKIITSHFIGLLSNREWPGNVRELENFIEKQFVISEEDVIDRLYSNFEENGKLEDNDSQIYVDGIMPIKKAVRKLEYILIKRAMEQGHTTYKAAELLGTSQPSLFRKYKELFKDEELGK